MPSPYSGWTLPVSRIVEFWITPSGDELRKCTPSALMFCTVTPSIVTWAELSTMMPLTAVFTVKPVSRQYGAWYSHSPYPGSKPAVGTLHEPAVEPDDSGLVRIAVAGPVRVIGADAVPAVRARNAPLYVPAASRMV